MDLKAEARRLAEETWRLELRYDARPNVKDIESALLAFGRLVREEDAKDAERRGNHGHAQDLREQLKALE